MQQHSALSAAVAHHILSRWCDRSVTELATSHLLIFERRREEGDNGTKQREADDREEITCRNEHAWVMDARHCYSGCKG